MGREGGRREGKWGGEGGARVSGEGGRREGKWEGREAGG